MHKRYLRFGMMGIGLLVLSCGQPADRTQSTDPSQPSGRIQPVATDSPVRKTSRDTTAVYREFGYYFDLLNTTVKGDLFPITRFSKEGPFSSVLEDVTRLQEADPVLKPFGVSFADLRLLALAYEASGGRETAGTRRLTQKIRRRLLPDREDSLKLSRLLSTSPFLADTTGRNLERELQNLKDRYLRVDSLYKKHYILKDTLAPLFWELCPQYYALRRKERSRNQEVYDRILQDYIGAAPASENRKFLSALLQQRQDTSLLAIERVLAPVYNFDQEVRGIHLDVNFFKPPPELRMFESVSSIPDSLKREWYGYRFFPEILEMRLAGLLKLTLYSKSGAHQVSVANFGRYRDECTDFFIYKIAGDSAAWTQEALMFASPFEPALEFGNYPEVDSLLSAHYPDICNDCPTSWEYQRTFARLKGLEEIYFSYAEEPGKGLDEVDTPLRAAFYVRDSLVIPLWEEYTDRFFCSCL